MNLSLPKTYFVCICSTMGHFLHIHQKMLERHIKLFKKQHCQTKCHLPR